MIKRCVAVILLLIIVFTCSSCDENYPYVIVNTSKVESNRVISMGRQYTYTGFDLENTDDGKDLILHFTEVNNEI